MAAQSHIGNAAYLDLLRMKKDEAVSDIRGAVVRHAHGDKGYLYDEFRVGTDLVRKYIGEDTPAACEKLSKAEEIRANLKASQARDRQLARVLRAEGYAGVDAATGSLLMNLARTGVFGLGGTIVGTVVFRLCEGELGVRIGGSYLAQTGDMDIASFQRLSLAIDDVVEKPNSEALSDLKFAPLPSMDKKSVWRWAQSSRGTLVEFLPPAFGEETIRELPSPGVSAQALNYLNCIIADPIKAVALYRSGVLVQIPRPEAYAIHKLIVADRRRRGTDELKSRKELAQAEFLIEALSELRPDELAEALEDAMSRGPKWQKRIGASLARPPKAAVRLAEISN